MTFAEVSAQAAPLELLRRICRTGQLAPAYLFDGPAGSGRAAAALALAQAMICKQAPAEGCGACSECRRVTDRVHPDVRHFAPKKEGSGNLEISVVRDELLPFCRSAPFEADRAFVIIEGAEVCFPDAYQESANALLKTLEEPRNGLHFILIAAAPAILLPTIRSRCQKVRFAPQSLEAMRGTLREQNLAPEAIDLGIALSQGSLARASEVANDVEPLNVIAELQRIDAVIDDASPGTRVSLAEELLAREDLASLLDTWAVLYRDATFENENLKWLTHLASYTRERRMKIGVRQAIARAMLLIEARTRLLTTANNALVVDELLTRLQEAS